MLASPAAGILDPCPSYVGATWCPASRRPADALESSGACNALRAADPQVHALRAAVIWFLQCLAGYRPTATLKPFWYWQVLWPANAQMLWSHLVLVMPCGLPTRSFFGSTWCLQCPAGTHRCFEIILCLANYLQLLWNHSVLILLCGCQPADALGPFGICDVLRAAIPQML